MTCSAQLEISATVLLVIAFFLEFERHDKIRSLIEGLKVTWRFFKTFNFTLKAMIVAQMILLQKAVLII